MGVSLEKASKEIHLAFKYLEALENDQLEALPGRVYLKVFLKKYCGYLHLDFSVCWALAQKMLAEQCPGQRSPIVCRRPLYQWSRQLFFGLAVLAVLLFLSFKLVNIFLPPEINIISPNDNLITDQPQIEVVGQSLPEAEIMVNNRQIFVDNNGGFIAQIDLQKGLNLIKITAKKRYSRMQEVTLRILFN